MKILLILPLILLSSLAVAQDSTVPDRLEGLPPLDTPAWLSLDQATRDGQIRKELLPAHAARALDAHASSSRRRSQGSPSLPRAVKSVESSRLPAPPPGTDFECTRFLSHMEDAPPGGYSSIEEVVSAAKAVAVGTVAEVGQGFFVGDPASLLALEPYRLLYRDDSYRLSRLLVHYGQAAFQVGGQDYCFDVPLLPNRPAPGDRLLVVATYLPRDAGRNVVTATSFGLFIERKNGELWIPEAFAEEARQRGWSSLEDIAGWVEGRLEPK